MYFREIFICVLFSITTIYGSIEKSPETSTNQLNFIKILCEFIPTKILCSSLKSICPTTTRTRTRTTNHCQTEVEESDNRVNISIYYEYLCPDSHDFIINQLWPAYQQINQIINFNLVPYGNAKTTQDPIRKNYQFQCQHGPTECLGNIYHVCAIDLMNVDEYIPFIVCTFNSTYWSHPTNATRQCAKKLGHIWDAVFHCVKGPKGNQLEYKAGLATPKHDFIPFIVVNGKPSEENQKLALKDLIQLICNNYHGDKKPAVCG